MISELSFWNRLSFFSCISPKREEEKKAAQPLKQPTHKHKHMLKISRGPLTIFGHLVVMAGSEGEQRRWENGERDPTTFTLTSQARGRERPVSLTWKPRLSAVGSCRREFRGSRSVGQATTAKKQDGQKKKQQRQGEFKDASSSLLLAFLGVTRPPSRSCRQAGRRTEPVPDLSHSRRLPHPLLLSQVFLHFFFFLYRLTLGSAALVMSSPQAQVSASSAGMRGQRSQRQRCRARSKATGAVWRN